MPPKKSKAEEETYEVEAVCDRRRTAIGIEYLIKWKGHVDTTWEPRDLCNCDDLINDYKRRFMPPNGTHSPPPPEKKESNDAAPTTSNERTSRGRPLRKQPSATPSSSPSSVRGRPQLSSQKKQQNMRKASVSVNTESDDDDDDDDESSAVSSSKKKTPKQQGSAERRKPVSSSTSSDTEKEDQEENMLSRAGKDSVRRSTRGTANQSSGKVIKTESDDDDDESSAVSSSKKTPKRRKVDDVGSSSSTNKGASTSTSTGRKPVYRSVTNEPKEPKEEFFSSVRRYDASAKRTCGAANRMSSGSFAITVGGSKVHMQRSSRASTDDSSVIVTAVRRRGPRRTGPMQPLSLEDMLVSTLIGNPYIIPLTWPSIVGFIEWKDQEPSLLGSPEQYDAEFASKPRKYTPADFPGITVWDEASYKAAGHSLIPPAGKAQPGDEKEKERKEDAQEEEEGEQFGGREVVRITAFVYDEKDPFVLVFLAPKENELVSDAVQAVNAHLATRLFPKAYDAYKYRVGQMLVHSLASSASSSTKDDEPGPSTRARAGRSQPNTPRTRAGPSTSSNPTGRGRRSEQ